MKKTFEEIEKELLEILDECTDFKFKAEGFDRILAINKLTRYVQSENKAYHADKLAEVAGEELPSGRYLINFLDPREYLLYDLDSYEKGINDLKEIGVTLLAKKQQQAKEEAVGFAEWIGKLSPTDKITAHPPAGSGGSTGIYLLTTEQLYAKYKEENTK